MYYGEAFVLNILTVAVSAILERLSHPQNPVVAYAPPEMLKRFLTGIPSSILCLRQHAATVRLSEKR